MSDHDLAVLAIIISVVSIAVNAVILWLNILTLRRNR